MMEPPQEVADSITTALAEQAAAYPMVLLILACVVGMLAGATCAGFAVNFVPKTWPERSTTAFLAMVFGAAFGALFASGDLLFWHAVGGGAAGGALAIPITPWLRRKLGNLP